MGGKAEAGRWDVSDGCAGSSGLAWEFSHTLCLAHMHLTYLGSLPGRTKGVALWKAKGGPNGSFASRDSVTVPSPPRALGRCWCCRIIQRGQD